MQAKFAYAGPGELALKVAFGEQLCDLWIAFAQAGSPRIDFGDARNVVFGIETERGFISCWFIDFGEFARHWGAAPLINQSRELDPGYAKEVLRNRLEYFRKVRRQVDPDNRMMNPFLSQYFL